MNVEILSNNLSRMWTSQKELSWQDSLL